MWINTEHDLKVKLKKITHYILSTTMISSATADIFAVILYFLAKLIFMCPFNPVDLLYTLSVGHQTPNVCFFSFRFPQNKP